MAYQEPETHVSKNDARGGSTPHVVRYVLFISLALIVLLMSGIWIIGSISM